MQLMDNEVKHFFFCVCVGGGGHEAPLPFVGCAPGNNADTVRGPLPHVDGMK